MKKLINLSFIPVNTDIALVVLRVWMGFGVFNSMRLLGVWFHYSRNGPLATRNMMKIKAQPL